MVVSEIAWLRQQVLGDSRQPYNPAPHLTH